jgi:hypothetical protein
VQEQVVVMEVAMDERRPGHVERRVERAGQRYEDVSVPVGVVEPARHVVANPPERLPALRHRRKPTSTAVEVASSSLSPERSPPGWAALDQHRAPAIVTAEQSHGAVAAPELQCIGSSSASSSSGGVTLSTIRRPAGATYE